MISPNVASPNGEGLQWSQPSSKEHWAPSEATKGRVMVVEDEQGLRDALGPLLEEEGYQVSFAENGHDALTKLNTAILPDLIVLDLKMPVMDGWEFRAIQKDDPKLGRIPVVAISADGSAQATAISAQAYLLKPISGQALLTTIERVMLEAQRQALSRMDETERLASLGRLAAGVGHEINNPLAFLVLNLSQSLQMLQSPAPTHEGHPTGHRAALRPEAELLELKARVACVADMLEDCRLGSERIRVTVSNLQRLSRKADHHRAALDLHQVIDQAVSMVWNQIRHRARLIKAYGALPVIRGDDAALGQVFLNILVNAAQAMPEGDTARNEIHISTGVVPTHDGNEIVVEILDSGRGMAPQDLSHVFEPFFTTKPTGQGTGLGLSMSRQTITDHGGRITVDSKEGTGTIFRVYLPINPDADVPLAIVPRIDYEAPLSRGRLLVIDDEPLIGRAIRTALNNEYEVIVVQRAADAITMLEEGKKFDLMLCDVVMPDITGPAFYATLLERWPRLVRRLVFMTGGAFTPGTVAFMKTAPTRFISKPFKIEVLKRLLSERLEGNA